MKIDKNALRLYAVTDCSWLNGQTLESAAEKALAAGATMLQLREKNLPDAELLVRAKALKAVAAKYGAALIVNDSVEVAIKSGADGVHVGQSDILGRDIRALIGADKILGISANTIEAARNAERLGADYIGVGAVFGTSTKQDAQTVSVERLKEICGAVSIPVVAIGGINAENILRLSGSGIEGVAVVSAIFAKPDIAAATAELRQLIERVVAVKIE